MTAHLVAASEWLSARDELPAVQGVSVDSGFSHRAERCNSRHVRVTVSRLHFPVAINVPIDVFCACAINVKSSTCSETTKHCLYKSHGHSEQPLVIIPQMLVLSLHIDDVIFIAHAQKRPSERL